MLETLFTAPPSRHTTEFLSLFGDGVHPICRFISIKNQLGGVLESGLKPLLAAGGGIVYSRSLIATDIILSQLGSFKRTSVTSLRQAI